MQSTSDTERRRFHRIEDEVGLTYAVVAEKDLDPVLAAFGDESRDVLALAASFASASHHMRHALEPVKADHPEIASYLEKLNEKVDMLVRLLALADQEFTDRPTHEVSLSASGVSFGMREPIEVGTILDVRLLLFPSHVCVRSLATVVTCEPAGEDDGGFQVRVDFSHIREEDRELVIKHVLQKESSLRRRRRAVEPD